MRIKRTLALHEAGHAVMAWYTGTLIYQVGCQTSDRFAEVLWIDRHGREVRVAGCLEHANRFNPMAGYPITAYRYPKLLERQAFHDLRIEGLISTAGEFAEMIAGGVAEDFEAMDYFITCSGDEGDAERLERLVEAAKGLRGWRGLWEHWSTETWRILKIPTVWGAVNSLADALQAQSVIAGVDAAALIRAAMGESADRPFNHLWPAYLKRHQRG